MNHLSADEIIRLLKLRPHPAEGGYFAETYRSAESIVAGALPARYGQNRRHGTAIYYLLKPGTFSALHRLKSDEIFHFYLGDPVQMLQLHPDGTGTTLTLGSAIETGERPQVLVPRGIWQGSHLLPGGELALLGCTVAPGFDYADYEHGDRATLISGYPAYRELIEQLTA